MPVPIANSDDANTDFFYDQFPPTFKWGSTSSATQIEGAWNIDGRSMSWWDSSARKNSASLIADHSRPDCGPDSYNKFTEDVKLLKEMNATCYKFSLSWSRLLPDGTTSKINKAGVEYYDNLINTLLAHNIEPVIVLYHWDFPQELFERHPFNWSDPSVVKAFGSYAQFCYKRFGDRVKRWIPIHDPWKHSECGFGSGIHPPNQKSGSPLKVFKNLLKAHTLAYRIYNKEFRPQQGGAIGLSVNSKCVSSSERNCLKNERAVPDFAACTELRPSFNPNASGDYESMCWNEMKETRADFIDLTNEDIHSELTLAELRNSSNSPKLRKRNSLPNLNNTRAVLNTIKKDLQNPEVLLCGKGYPLIGTEITSLIDLKRTQYFKSYANEILKAVVLDGCNVVGFLPGTLVDSWEWEHGFSLSYGLHQVKFDHPLKYRIQRLSAKYLTKLFSMHGFSKQWDIDSVHDL